MTRSKTIASVSLWALALTMLAACGQPLEAPRNASVCWRLGPGMNSQPDFRPLSNGVDTLENCAVQLEGLSRAGKRPVTGAFQGRFIFVTDESVTAAAAEHAQRYRVFSPEQRAKIDAGFDTLEAR